MNNTKPVGVRLSSDEKDLFFKICNQMGFKPSTVLKNIIKRLIKIKGQNDYVDIVAVVDGYIKDVKTFYFKKAEIQKKLNDALSEIEG